MECPPAYRSKILRIVSAWFNKSRCFVFNANYSHPNQFYSIEIGNLSRSVAGFSFGATSLQLLVSVFEVLGTT